MQWEGYMMVRTTLIALFAAGGIGIFAASNASAMPVSGGGIADAIRADSLVQEARVYCHRGPVFLHWGPGGRPIVRYYRPLSVLWTLSALALAQTNTTN